MQTASRPATAPLRQGIAPAAGCRNPARTPRPIPASSRPYPRVWAVRSRMRPLGIGRSGRSIASSVRVADVVQDDACGVQQSRGGGQADQDRQRLEVRVHQQVPRRHVGQGGEDVGQAQQLQKGQKHGTCCLSAFGPAGRAVCCQRSNTRGIGFLPVRILHSDCRFCVVFPFDWRPAYPATKSIAREGRWSFTGSCSSRLFAVGREPRPPATGRPSGPPRRW